jgi:hypothetical protein
MKNMFVLSLLPWSCRPEFHELRWDLRDAEALQHQNAITDIINGRLILPAGSHAFDIARSPIICEKNKWNRAKETIYENSMMVCSLLRLQYDFYGRSR